MLLAGFCWLSQPWEYLLCQLCCPVSDGHSRAGPPLPWSAWQPREGARPHHCCNQQPDASARDMPGSLCGAHCVSLYMAACYSQTLFDCEVHIAAPVINAHAIDACVNACHCVSVLLGRANSVVPAMRCRVQLGVRCCTQCYSTHISEQYAVR